jgi:hypothetical protein
LIGGFIPVPNGEPRRKRAGRIFNAGSGDNPKRLFVMASLAHAAFGL